MASEIVYVYQKKKSAECGTMENSYVYLHFSKN